MKQFIHVGSILGFTVFMVMSLIDIGKRFLDENYGLDSIDYFILMMIFLIIGTATHQKVVLDGKSGN